MFCSKLMIQELFFVDVERYYQFLCITCSYLSQRERISAEISYAFKEALYSPNLTAQNIQESSVQNRTPETSDCSWNIWLQLPIQSQGCRVIWWGPCDTTVFLSCLVFVPAWVHRGSVFNQTSLYTMLSCILCVLLSAVLFTFLLECSVHTNSTKRNWRIQSK